MEGYYQEFDLSMKTDTLWKLLTPIPTVFRMYGDLGNFYSFLWKSCLPLHAEVMIAQPDLRKPIKIIHL